MIIKLSSNNVLQYLIDTKNLPIEDKKLIKVVPMCSKAGINKLIFLRIYLQNGCQLVVKQAHNHSDSNSINIIKSEWQLYEFLRSCQDKAYTSFLNLEILHFDELNSIFIYKIPKKYVNLETYYINKKKFSPAIAYLAGTTLATLHSETLTSHNCYDFMNKSVLKKLRYKFPYPSYLLDRLEPETLLQEFPPEGNNFINFYQNSKNLRTAVTELVVNHNHYCLTHNNPQLDNILISMRWEDLLSQTNPSHERIIKMINWESCSWGDPAFDLGTVIAGYLLLWLNSLIIHPNIELEKSLQLATTPLEIIQPSIVALIRAYIRTFPKILEEIPDFINRVFQFTGLALIYKIIEKIQSFQDFNLHSIYIAKVATQLLCNPEKSFYYVIPKTELELVNLIKLSDNKQFE